jgi:[ribosomal protein S5]-alanine N-acetyltransferase
MGGRGLAGAVMTMFPASFITDRLVLRPIAEADAAAAFAEYAADPLVTRYLTWVPHDSEQSCAAFFAEQAARHAAGTLGAYAITLRNNGRLIGAFDLRSDAAGHRVDFGCVLGRIHWRQGYMSEALSHVVGWVLGQPTVYRIWAVTDVENVASARTMEKAGLMREGVLRRWFVHPNLGPEPRDCFRYARVR